MNILQPVYYEEFECIADRCKDSCCTGWKVIIDKKSFYKYKKVKGEFGHRLNKNIKRNRNDEGENNYGEMILTNGARCSFLNESNLCDIYINQGPDYLCNVCTTYPRQIHKYDNIIERNLTLSCPRVAEILVSISDPLDFEMKNEPLHKENIRMYMHKHNSQLYSLLWEGRSFSIDIAQFREIPIWKRLVFIKIAEGRLQKLIESGEFSKTNEVIENLRNEINNKDVIDSLDNIDKVSNVVKIKLISLVIQGRLDSGVSNGMFEQMITNLNEFFGNKTNKDIQIFLEQKQSEFDKYFTNREYILENYIVYNLYTMYMKALDTSDLNKEISRLMISYSVIKLFLISTWEKNNGELIEEDIVNVLYCFSKILEHDENFMGFLYKEMKSKGYDSIGYLVTMIY